VLVQFEHFGDGFAVVIAIRALELRLNFFVLCCSFNIRLSHRLSFILIFLREEAFDLGSEAEESSLDSLSLLLDLDFFPALANLGTCTLGTIRDRFTQVGGAALKICVLPFLLNACARAPEKAVNFVECVLIIDSVPTEILCFVEIRLALSLEIGIVI